MSFRINTNINGLFSHVYGNQINREISKSMERLSTGLKLNYAADGSADLAIADQLRSQHTGLTAAIKNSNDGIGLLKIADGALKEYTNILDKVQDKVNSAVNDTMSDDARTALENDVNKLLSQANNIATRTKYNGINLLDGTFSNKTFQTGAYSGETTNISIGDATIATQGLDSSNIDLSDSTAATTTLTSVETAITSIDGIRSSIGSDQINLESNVRNLETTSVNVKASESQLRDTDYAAEQEKLNKNSIRAQANAFAMEKGTQIQALVLNLLR